MMRGSNRGALPWLIAAGLAVLLTVAVAALLAALARQAPSTASAVATASSTLTASPSPMPEENAPSTAKPSGKKGGKPTDTANPTVTDARPGQGPLPTAQEVPCPGATTTVSTAAELTSALSSAKPGDAISLKDGTYKGNFAAKNSGTDAAPIFLCGGPGAVLDGGDKANGYVFHLDGASHWVLSGFTVQDGQKGVVADHSAGSVVEHLMVTDIGDEAIHLRENSTSNLVLGNTVSHTGSHNGKFGEGIYVGTAESNWCTYTNCQPDASNYNILADNTVSNTTAENVDIKEGTIGGVIRGNHFDGTGMTSATAWVNVKGNAWTIQANTGQNSPQDGYQTHNILGAWGDNNLFEDNTGSVGGPGYAFALRPAMHNTVACTNTLTGGAGLSNIPCANP